MRSLRFQAKGIANTCLRASAERQAADNQKKAFSYDDFEAAFAQLGWECDDALKKRLFREVRSSIPSPANKECNVTCTSAYADFVLSVPCVRAQMDANSGGNLSLPEFIRGLQKYQDDHHVILQAHFSSSSTLASPRIMFVQILIRDGALSTRALVL
jgi:hypothetical protein